MTDYEEQKRLITHIAYDLRGSMNIYAYRSYVLDLVFYRYLSEQVEQFVQSLSGVSYREMSDKDAEQYHIRVVSTLGYFIYPSRLFASVYKASTTIPHLELRLQDIFQDIEKSSVGRFAEPMFRSVFNGFAVVPLQHLPISANSYLVRLMESINKLDLSESTLLVHDIYDSIFSFFQRDTTSTPTQVARLIASLATLEKKHVRAVYDPSCGVGKILLAISEVMSEKEGTVDLGYYGQETNGHRYNFARMAMMMADLPVTHCSFVCRDALHDPQYQSIAPFDCIVTSLSETALWDGFNSFERADTRFTLLTDDLPMGGKSRWAYIMHILSYLSDNGRAVIAVHDSFLTDKGIDQLTRRYLLDHHYVESIVRLPDNLFPYPCNLLVLSQDPQRMTVRFIDARHEYEHGLLKPRLTDTNIQHIVWAAQAYRNIPNLVQCLPYDVLHAHQDILSVDTYTPQEHTTTPRVMAQDKENSDDTNEIPVSTSNKTIKQQTTKQ
ncbi:MAG: N-6 DNA methylase [Aeriscardovia sp.]|nr:N-6 DNA methylase [Aeriscardovia sp.]